MLKQRLIFGALGIILALAVIIFCPVNIIGICVGIISLIGLTEFFKVTGLVSKKSPAIILGYVFCIACFLAVIWQSEASFAYMLSACLAFVFLLMLFMVLFHQKCSFYDCATVFFGTIYVALFFLHIVLIRQLTLGNLLIWILFISAWSTDTFAYFFGRAIGKHKLCPSISPKKTVEGAVGGVLGCVICVMLYVFLVACYNELSVNYVNAAILAAIASVVSQFGDLAASCIKREHGVKDYGNLIPGHGGILDRFDSVLLISPVVYYLMIYLPIFA